MRGMLALRDVTNIYRRAVGCIGCTAGNCTRRAGVAKDQHGRALWTLSPRAWAIIFGRRTKPRHAWSSGAQASLPSFSIPRASRAPSASANPSIPKSVFPGTRGRLEMYKQPAQRVSHTLSLPPKWLGMYGDFIIKNASAVSQIESTLRSLTYIIPGV